MSPEQERELEESLVNARNYLPRAWWNLYQGCLASGFDRLQAFVLLQTYILAQNPSGIRPAPGEGPGSDNPE